MAKYEGQTEVGKVKYDPKNNNETIKQLEQDIEELEKEKEELKKGKHANAE